jgi:TonB family protein
MPQDARTAVVNAPNPEYPLEARQRHERGSGIFLLRANIPSGRVIQVIVARTTGYKSLDAAAVKAFSQWRFKPGALVHHDIHKPRLSPPVSKEQCLILLPVTFTL